MRDGAPDAGRAGPERLSADQRQCGGCKRRRHTVLPESTECIDSTLYVALTCEDVDNPANTSALNAAGYSVGAVLAVAFTCRGGVDGRPKTKRQPA